MLVFLSFLTIAVFPSLAKYPSAFRVPDDGRAQITRKVLGLKLPDLQLVLSGGGNFSTCHDFDNELSTTNKYMMTSYGESFLSLKRLLDYENELVEPLRDCAQGVFLLHVLAIEASIGQAGDERPARHLYRLAANILDVFGPFMNNTRWTKAVEKKPGWNETWIVQADFKLDISSPNPLLWLEPFFWEYSLLLEARPRHDCSGFAPTPGKRGGKTLRIFVYDETPWREALVPSSITCVKNSQWAFEAVWHKWFLQGSCRTNDPSAADFFFVPAYPMCARVASKTKYNFDPEFQFLVESIRSFGPWFDRSGGADHIFVWVDDVEIFFPSWRKFIPHSIFLTPDAVRPGQQWKYSIFPDKKEPPMFDPWRDVVVPSYTDTARVAKLRRFSRPYSERVLLASFVGRSPNSSSLYADNDVRQKLFELKDKPQFLIEERVTEAFAVKGLSIFCLVPRGTSTWTNHLYEALFAGCIPVILSDKWALPFSGGILGFDWSDISIRYPEAEIGEMLHRFLGFALIDHPEELKKTMRKIESVSCWMDYTSPDPSCSPFLAAMDQLYEKFVFLKKLLF